jgi:uncharacterized protein YdhG (YjbR/CyaY superfamily)
VNGNDNRKEVEGMEEKSDSIDQYIGAFPEPVRTLLNAMRAIIRSEAPEAVERISYRMPAFDRNGILVYFAGYARHIGFYPTSSGIEAFKNELGEYKYSKGAIRFPIDRPLPEALIRRIVRFRLEENSKKT